MLKLSNHGEDAVDSQGFGETEARLFYNQINYIVILPSICDSID